MREYDVIFAGGGLASGLAAYRLRTLRPELRLCVVEREPEPGGNHTWSFFSSDVSARGRAWIAPFVRVAWPHYQVNFGGYTRILKTGYASIDSATFARVLRRALPAGSIIRGSAVRLDANSVELESGERLGAAAVIDGRGPVPSTRLAIAYQKFFGIHAGVREPHGLSGPVIMDATVEQRDGFRFVYVLPLGPHELLIEDTFYSDNAALVPERCRLDIEAYAIRQGWRLTETLREEHGVLPIVLDGDFAGYYRALEHPAAAGLRALCFHPVTGYSLPDAVAVADKLAQLRVLSTASAAACIGAYAARRWRRHGPYRLLNRLLFEAAAPAARHRVLERFYRLPRPLIERFYAGRNTPLDWLRIFAGRPPVPLRAALQTILRRPQDFSSTSG